MGTQLPLPQMGTYLLWPNDWMDQDVDVTSDNLKMHRYQRQITR